MPAGSAAWKYSTHASMSWARVRRHLRYHLVAGAEPGGFRLARYQSACCAADAAPVVVRIEGVHGDLPLLDEWVTVTGRFVGAGGDVPALAATTVTPIAPPDEPYE